jgi:hypothetical protein
VLETFRQKTGQADPEAYFGVEMRFVGLDLPPERAATAEQERRAAFGLYYPGLPAEVLAKAEITEWGTAHLPGTFYHFTSMAYPMQRRLGQAFTTLPEFEAFPLPNFAEDWRYAYARQRIVACHERRLAVCGAMGVTIFEGAWQLTGMEQLFSDFKFHPELAACRIGSSPSAARWRASSLPKTWTCWCLVLRTAWSRTYPGKTSWRCTGRSRRMAAMSETVSSEQ